MNDSEQELLEISERLAEIKLSEKTIGVLVGLVLKQDPQIASKMHELDFQRRHPDYRVRPEKQGVDLVNTKTNKPLEHKAVTCTSDSAGTVNFPLPVMKKGEPVDAYRARVYKSQLAKGTVCIEVKDRSNNVQETFYFSEEFISGYVSRVTDIEQRSKVVLSVKRCKRCKKFHKLDHLKRSEPQVQRYADKSFWDEVHAIPKCQTAKKK